MQGRCVIGTAHAWMWLIYDCICHSCSSERDAPLFWIWMLTTVHVIIRSCCLFSYVSPNSLQAGVVINSCEVDEGQRKLSYVNTTHQRLTSPSPSQASRLYWNGWWNIIHAFQYYLYCALTDFSWWNLNTSMINAAQVVSIRSKS